MNFLGIDILQLIVYGCVFACVIIVVYILKLTRSKKKTGSVFENDQLVSEDIITIRQLITLIDKMYSHQVGLTQTSTSNPNHEPERQTPMVETKEEEEPQPTQAPSLPLSHIDEETYVPTSEDKKLLEKIRKLLKEKE